MKFVKTLILAFLLILPQVGFSQPQQDCKAVNCTGQCDRFVDRNGDGFCDHGRVVDTTAKDGPKTEVKAEAPKGHDKQKGGGFNSILILSLTFGLYLVSMVLVKAKVWKKATHRKVWNVLLLLTGLGSCLLGLLLAIVKDGLMTIDWFRTAKLYHVELGIALTLIMIIHTLWHLAYWKNLFKK